MKIDYEGVIISKGGLKESVWDQERQKYTVIPVDPLRVFAKLRMSCFVEDDVTLLDFINIVDEIKPLKLFISQYSWCRAIDEFHAQAREPMRTDENPILYLEVRWLKSCGEHYPSTDFVGFAKEPPGYEFPDGTGMVRYSVSYTPLYNLADAKLRLNPIHNGKTLYFTFLDVLDAVYDDISFMGGPQDNVEFLEEMKSRMEEFEAQLEEGTARFVNLDEWISEEVDEEGDEDELQV